jgi:acetyl esterase/lipase
MKQILFFNLLCICALSSAQYKTETDVLYNNDNDAYIQERCRLDLYYPENKNDYVTVVWFHGGGLTGGSKFIPDHWRNKGFAIASANYRLSPKVTSPAYIEDAAAAIAWVFANIERYGGSKRKIIVAGHSAGAYLTCMTGLDKRYLAKHGIDADSILALLPFSSQVITHQTIRREAGISNLQPVIDSMAPLYHVRPEAPPLYLLTGDRELEMLGRYEENAYLARMMKLNGHNNTFLFEFDGFDHGGMVTPGYELTLKIISEIILER